MLRHMSRLPVVSAGKLPRGQCNVRKLPPRATLMQSILNSTKLPHPEV